MSSHSDLKEELATLSKADIDLSKGERRISEQVLLIAHLKKGGHETKLAEDLLRSLEGQLEQWRTHRAIIIERIEELRARQGQQFESASRK